MKTLYPSFQKNSLLLIALLVAGVIHAQDKTYAAVTKQNTSSSSVTINRTGIIDPVVKVRSRTDKKIILSWAPIRGEVSHYILERSTDGRTFEEAGLYFTGESDAEPECVFTDRFKSSYPGPLFYRLRVVGFNEDEIYTPVTILNAGR